MRTDIKSSPTFSKKNDLPAENGKTRNRVKRDIEHGRNSAYTSKLISSYPYFDFPAWAFLEIITFGTFIEFLRFCANRFTDRRLKDEYYLLQKVKSIRNACAHNNCILNDLSAHTSKHRIPNRISRAVGTVTTIGQDARKSRLSNERLQEVATTLYMHRELASNEMHRHRPIELAMFKERMLRNQSFFSTNNQVHASFAFIQNLIESWYCVDPKLKNA